MRASIKILFLLLTGFIFACNKQEEKKDEHEGMDMMNMVHLSKHEREIINLKIDTALIQTIYEVADFVGIAAIAEDNVNAVSSRVNGRIDKLYVRNPGEEIKKGQLLYSIYSEELLSDENEFLLSLEQQSKFNAQKGTVEAIVKSSRKKLLLWGLSEEQINELAKNKVVSPTANFYSNVNGYLAELNINEGEYVSTGTSIFKITSLETVWVNAEIYQGEVSYFLSNPQVDLKFEAIPNKLYQGQIIQNPPVLEPDKKVSSVKIRIHNSDRKIKPGMMATVSVKRNQKRTLVIPKSALVPGHMISVWIETQPGMYENRMVETGIENKTEVEILSGLKEGERIVSSGSYLLNSAYILQNGANSMPGMEM